MKIRVLALSSFLAVALGCNQAPSPAGQETAAGAQATPSSALTSDAPKGAGGGGTASSAPAAAATSTAKEASKAPAMMEMEVPAGTTLEVTVETTVASDKSKAEDAVRGRVAKPVTVSGMT